MGGGGRRGKLSPEKRIGKDNNSKYVFKLKNDTVLSHYKLVKAFVLLLGRAVFS